MGRSDRTAEKTLLFVLALLAYGFASAQTLYKYRGENGEWIFSDRPPDDGRDAEIRTLDSRAAKGKVTVTHSFTGDGLAFTAQNRFFAPMEVAVEFASIEGVEYPHPDQERRWVVPARSDLVLLELTVLGDVEAPSVQYRYSYLPGDPRARPAEGVSYRAPFTLGSSFPITQSYPDSLTHRTRDSMHAVDFEMPVGTDVVAARDGIVFEVSSTNFKGGQDAGRYANLANLVRILHEDGTYALYGHLNWNSIRVRPGDRVKAGQHIADSGNTGFTTGPHLHFAVQRNMGMRVDSIPVEFRGAANTRVTPLTGSELTAYP